MATIEQFLKEYEIPFESNMNYIKADGSKNGYSIKNDRPREEVKDTHVSSKWINVFPKYSEHPIYILDCDDVEMGREQIVKQVTEAFGFTPPYTLSSTKKLPHFYIALENCPIITNTVQNCFPACKADLLRFVVEERNAIVYENKDLEVLDWKDMEKHFSFKQKVQKEVKVKAVGEFSEAITLIKASKYYDTAFDLDNINVIDSNKFQFKAIDKFVCKCCNRTHIKNNNHILVDCSNGIKMACRPNEKAVWIKEPQKNEKCINMDEDINCETYDVVKQEFEKDFNHFYCRMTQQFYRKSNDGEYHPHSATAFKVFLSNLFYKGFDINKNKFVKKQFFNTWVSDESRLEIEDFMYELNPELSNKKDYINLWKGFEILKHEPLEDATATIEQWNHWINVICNKDEKVVQYIHHWIAQAIQRPWKRNIVAPLFQSSSQGGGKSTFGVAISAMMGQQKYYQSGVGFSKIFPKDGFNDVIRDCFIYGAEELDGVSARQQIDQFKEFTTSERVLINKKGEAKYDIPNKINMYMTSNNTNPVPIGEQERRILPINCSDDLVGNKEFWKSFYENIIGNKSACRSMFDYYNDSERFNLDKWNSKDIPKTEYFNILKEASKDPIETILLNNEQYLRTLSEWFKPNDILGKINQELTNMKLNSINVVQIGLKLSTLTFCKKLFNKKHTKLGNLYSINQTFMDELFGCKIEE